MPISQGSFVGFDFSREGREFRNYESRVEVSASGNFYLLNKEPTEVGTLNTVQLKQVFTSSRN